MDALNSERAPPLITPVSEACDPETEGVKELLPEEPATAVPELAADAEPDDCPVAELGPFRADRREPVAACAMDCAAAPDMD